MDTWINVLEKNCLSREDEKHFKRIYTEMTTPTLEDFRRKRLTLFTDIRGD